MLRRETIPATAATLLSVLALGAAATALESAPIGSPYSAPAAENGGPGLSILDVLQLLLVAVLEAVGLDIGSPAVGAPSAGAIDGVVAALAVLRSVAAPLLAVVAVGTAVLLVGRRLPAAKTGAIRDLLTALRRPTEPPRSEPTADAWPPADPDTEVAEAWVAMTERLEIDRPRCRTPAEWADAAVDAGFDEGAVDDLTDAFRAVRYGNATETPDRRRRAKRDLGTLEADRE